MKPSKKAESRNDEIRNQNSRLATFRPLLFLLSIFCFSNFGFPQSTIPLLVHTNGSLVPNAAGGTTNFFLANSNQLAQAITAIGITGGGGGGGVTSGQLTSQGTAITNWVGALGYVTSAVTNGLASIGWLTAQNYITATVTNGLASLAALQAATNNVPLAALPSALRPLANNNAGGVTNIPGTALVSMIDQSNLPPNVITNGQESTATIEAQMALNGSATITDSYGDPAADFTQGLLSWGVVFNDVVLDWANQQLYSLPVSSGPSVLSVDWQNHILAGGPWGGDAGAMTNVHSTNIVGPYFTNITVVSDSLTTNLNQWVSTGTAGVFSIQSNTLAVAGVLADSYGDYLYNTNFPDACHSYTIKFTCRILQTNQSTSGVAIGELSQESYDGQNSLFFDLCTENDGYHGGVFVFYGNGTFQPVGNSIGTVNIVTNQPYDFTLVRRDEQYSLSISNQVSGAVFSFTYAYAEDSTVNGYSASGRYFPAIYSRGAACVNIVNFSETVDTFWPVQLLCVGDSITSGYGFSDPEAGWARRLQRAIGPGVVIDAAGGAISVDVTNWTLAKLLKPQNLILDIGVNDTANGIPLATTKANITNFIGLNSNYVGHFYVATTTPLANFNSSNLVAWVQTNYPWSNTLNFFDPLSTPLATTLWTNKSFDGIHPNAAGNGTLFNVVYDRLFNHVAAP